MTINPIPRTNISADYDMDALSCLHERFWESIFTFPGMAEAFVQHPGRFIIRTVKDPRKPMISISLLHSADFVMVNGRILKNRFGPPDE
jgi:hypothetical protein